VRSPINVSFSGEKIPSGRAPLVFSTATSAGAQQRIGARLVPVTTSDETKRGRRETLRDVDPAPAVGATSEKLDVVRIRGRWPAAGPVSGPWALNACRRERVELGGCWRRDADRDGVLVHGPRTLRRCSRWAKAPATGRARRRKKAQEFFAWAEKGRRKNIGPAETFLFARRPAHNNSYFLTIFIFPHSDTRRHQGGSSSK